MTGRSILGALVRSQWRLGLCPKMKYHPLCGWIIILYVAFAYELFALVSQSEQGAFFCRLRIFDQL